MSLAPPPPADLAGLPVHPVTMPQALLCVEAAIDRASCRGRSRPFRHVALNAAKVVACRDDAALLHIVRSADLVTADGVGVLALAHRLGRPLPARVTGIDLMEGLCARAAMRGWPVFLLGGEPGVAAGAAASLRRRYPELRIAGTRHGFFPPQDDRGEAERVARSGARLLFVAMSTPRKEHFADRWAAAANVDFVMGVGGAFDVLVGRRRRAPMWVQGLGLEWAFRWAQEPRRLAPRYGIDGSRFLAHLARPVPLPGELVRRDDDRDLRVVSGRGA